MYGKKSNDDSFGLVALCSVGPILAVLVLGFFTEAGNDVHQYETINTFVLALKDEFTEEEMLEIFEFCETSGSYLVSIFVEKVKNSKYKFDTDIVFNIAFNYGGRDEIIRAIKKIAKHVKDGKLEINGIYEEMFDKTYE